MAFIVDGSVFSNVLVVWVEIGTFAPPYGSRLFDLQGVMKASYSDTVIGVLPFIPIWTLGVILLYGFLDLVLGLPSQLFVRSGAEDTRSMTRKDGRVEIRISSESLTRPSSIHESTREST